MSCCVFVFVFVCRSVLVNMRMGMFVTYRVMHMYSWSNHCTICSFHILALFFANSSDCSCLNLCLLTFTKNSCFVLNRRSFVWSHPLHFSFSANKHKPWIETEYQGIVMENDNTVLLNPPLFALDKDAPLHYAGKDADNDKKCVVLWRLS